MALLSPQDAQALAKLVHEHHDFIWRSLRRLGLGHGDVDDAVQQVFLIASRRLATIRPGSERSFLFQTALRIASDVRRGLRRRRETAPLDSDKVAQAAIPADELIDLWRAREKLRDPRRHAPRASRGIYSLRARRDHHDRNREHLAIANRYRRLSASPGARNISTARATRDGIASRTP